MSLVAKSSSPGPHVTLGRSICPSRHLFWFLGCSSTSMTLTMSEITGHSFPRTSLNLDSYISMIRPSLCVSGQNVTKVKLRSLHCIVVFGVMWEGPVFGGAGFAHSIMVKCTRSLPFTVSEYSVGDASRWCENLILLSTHLLENRSPIRFCQN